VLVPFDDLALQEVVRNPTRYRFFVSIGIPDSKEVVSGDYGLTRAGLCAMLPSVAEHSRCCAEPSSAPARRGGHMQRPVTCPACRHREHRRVADRNSIPIESFRSHPWIQKHPGDRIAGQLFMRRIVSHRNCRPLHFNELGPHSPKPRAPRMVRHGACLSLRTRRQDGPRKEGGHEDGERGSVGGSSDGTPEQL
jgi:hypothetical protein